MADAFSLMVNIYALYTCIYMVYTVLQYLNMYKNIFSLHMKIYDYASTPVLAFPYSQCVSHLFKGITAVSAFKVLDINCGEVEMVR